MIKMDLMKTIEDDEDVEYFSEDSNQEEEAQPKKKTVKKKLKKGEQKWDLKLNYVLVMKGINYLQRVLNHF